jgi:hypothetical protein
MYNSFLFYVLLSVSILIFSIYIYAIIINKNTSKDFEFFEVLYVDKSAYWSYNDNMYSADLKENSIDKDSIKKIDYLGMSIKDAEDILRGCRTK